MSSSAAHPSFRLAAYACAAIEGLNVTSVSASREDEESVRASLTSSSGNRYQVVSAKTPEASTRLLIESHVLSIVQQVISSSVSVSRVAGRYSQGTLSTVVYADADGRPLEEGSLEDSAETRRAVGEAIAAIHLMPAHTLEDEGLPFYEAHEVRARQLNLLDAVAATGRVPSVLLTRWEEVLDEAGLWRFTSVPVHGDLHEDRFHTTGDRLRISDWAALSVSDPAEDFAWIMALAPDLRKDVFEAYFSALARHRYPRDAALERRALFNAEFAVAEYLMTGLRQGDDERVDLASRLLADLAERLEAQGETRKKPRNLTLVPPVGAAAPAGTAEPVDSAAPVNSAAPVDSAAQAGSHTGSHTPEARDARASGDASAPAEPAESASAPADSETTDSETIAATVSVEPADADNSPESSSDEEKKSVVPLSPEETVEAHDADAPSPESPAKDVEPEAVTTRHPVINRPAGPAAADEKN